MFVWQAHKGKIRSLAFGPDGRLLATATGSSRFVSLWNPVTGKLAHKLEPKPRLRPPPPVPASSRYTLQPTPFDRAALAVAFAPDAPLFAAGMSDSVRIWNTASWQEVATLTGQERWVGGFFELTFGPGPAPRVAAGDSRAVRVWDDAGATDASTDVRYANTTFGISEVPCLDFSLGGTLLATNVLAKAELWNPVTGASVRAIPHTHSGHHGPVKFSPDGTRLAVGYRKLVSIYPVTEGDAEEVVCKGHTKPVWSACWSKDGRTLLTASADGTAKLWNPQTGEEQKSFDWGIGEIRAVAFSADGLLGAAAGTDGKVVVWDVDS